MMRFPSLAIRLAGDFDAGIDDNDRFNLQGTELRMTGSGEQTQGLEVMSVNVGASSRGLDRSIEHHFPLDTLWVGPTSAVVSLRDDHDNDGRSQDDCEAVYIRNLVVDAGATLLTNACKIYYMTKTIDPDAIIDDPANLI